MEQLDLNFVRSHFPAFSEEKLKDKAFLKMLVDHICVSRL